MAKHHSPTQQYRRTMTILFFVVVVIAALFVVMFSLRYGENVNSSNSNVNQNSNVNNARNTNTNTAAVNQNTNTAVVDSAFLAEHGWDTVVIHDRESKYTSQENIETYDFGTPNAIIDTPKEYVSMITEAYGRISATTVHVGGVIVDRVVGASARDGSRMEYMVIPYTSLHSLVVRGSGSFLDSVTTSLVLSQ